MANLFLHLTGAPLRCTPSGEKYVIQEKHTISRLNKSEQNMIERLVSMTIDEARTALSEKQLGDIGSPNHRMVLELTDQERK